MHKRGLVMVNNSIEKYAIFSEGFRGVPNGWHTLAACNFLVGENSTGKSSFLQLLELVESDEHIVRMKLCGVIEGLDMPLDVLSRIGGSKYTTVGFLFQLRNNNDDENQGEHNRFFGRLATYKSVNDGMRLERITLFFSNRILRIVRRSEKISYRIDEFQYDESISLAENGARIKTLHDQKSSNQRRFKTHINVKWANVITSSIWMRTILNITEEIDSHYIGYVYNFRPILNCYSHGPMRIKAQRILFGATKEFSSTGEHIPYVLRDVINRKPNLTKAINEFGEVSGLYDKITISSITTKIKDSPFALQLEKSGKHFYVDELGYGVGQVLPIITDLVLSPSTKGFLIQQPELHLHPKAQASLAVVFLETICDQRMLMIETHSDYIIDRYRIEHKNSKSSPDSQIIYFEKNHKGFNEAYEININDDGTLGDVPSGYRDFFVKESIDKFENL